MNSEPNRTRIHSGAGERGGYGGASSGPPIFK